MGTCALCEINKDLKESHIIPKFVFKSIKKRSATGYLREVKSPNIRKQDGFKVDMLCDISENSIKVFEQPEPPPLLSQQNSPTAIYKHFLNKWKWINVC